MAQMIFYYTGSNDDIGYTKDSTSTKGVNWDSDGYIQGSDGSVHMAVFKMNGNSFTTNGSDSTFQNIHVTSAQLQLEWDVAGGGTNAYWRIGIQDSQTAFGKDAHDGKKGKGTACYFRGDIKQWIIGVANDGGTSNGSVAKFKVTSLLKKSGVNAKSGFGLGINYYTGSSTTENPAGSAIGTANCRFEHDSIGTTPRIIVDYIPRIAKVSFTTPSSGSVSNVPTRSYTVSWKKTDPDGVGTGSYRYSYSTDGGSTWSSWVTTTATSYSVPNPNVGTANSVIVKVQTYSQNPTTNTYTTDSQGAFYSDSEARATVNFQASTLAKLSSVSIGDYITKTQMDALRSYIQALNKQYGTSTDTTNPTAVTQYNPIKSSDWSTYASYSNLTPYVSGLGSPTAGAKATAAFYNNYVTKLNNG